MRERERGSERGMSREGLHVSVKKEPQVYCKQQDYERSLE